MVYLHSTAAKPLDQADLAAFGTALGKAAGVATVAPPQPSSDSETALYSVTLSSDPTCDTSLADVKGPIRDAAHAAAPGHRGVGRRDHIGLLVFQHLKGDQGLIFLLPIYIYLFVVALGTDYNILMVARLREEARDGLEQRDAAAEAVRHAGPTIGAAGLILAGTFASLMLGGNSLLVALGFSISFGIFVAAFVMAMFFTPALTALIGHAAWWPGHGDETRS